MNRKHQITIGIIVAVFLIVAIILSLDTDKTVNVDSGNRRVMGTFARIVVVARSSAKAKRCIDVGFKQLSSIEELMSYHKDDSQISRVNRDAYKNPIEVTDPLFEVLQKSVEFSRLSNGAFDITVGPLVDLYNAAKEKGFLPAEGQIALAKSKVGFEKLVLDEQNKTVKFSVDGMKLDLGGIAKGYAIDKTIEAIQAKGALGAMVDVGGDIRCFGTPPEDREKWLIALQDPSQPQTDLGISQTTLTMAFTDAAIATSGDYRRFVLIGGEKYSHIIDRSTATAAKGLSSVTIICPQAITADALATAVNVMGSEKGLKLIESLPETEAILLSPGPQYQRTQTKGAQKYIQE